jgi:hypothetical protein
MSSAEREQARFGIPRDAARFSIAATTDSTVTFRPVEVRWLKPGMQGHAVDPKERDALIARLTIQRVDTSGIVAAIDGRVAQVATTHVVLMVKPGTAWWKDLRFWSGTGAGVVAGVIAASAGK